MKADLASRLEAAVTQETAGAAEAAAQPAAAPAAQEAAAAELPQREGNRRSRAAIPAPTAAPASTAAAAAAAPSAAQDPQPANPRTIVFNKVKSLATAVLAANLRLTACHFQ